jgi:hypothetical protein
MTESAEELCDLQAVFWVPSSTWIWKSTSGSIRAEWMVQVISHHEEDGDVLFNVCIIHQSDHYKYGDIRVTSSYGRPSIRSIIQLHGAREREGGLHINLPVRRTHHSVADRYSPHRKYRDGRCFKQRQPRTQSSPIGLPCGSSYRSGNAQADVPSIGRFRQTANSTTNWMC